MKYSISNLCELRSDHTPVLIVNDTSKPNISHTSLSQGSFNWDNFSKIIQNGINLQLSLKINNNIENTAHDLTFSIQSAVYESSYNINKTNQSHLYKEMLPAHITDLISQKL